MMKRFVVSIGMMVFVLVGLPARPASAEYRANWHAEFYDNPDLQGVPVVTRIDPQVRYNWRDGSPDPRIPSDYFSARWTAVVNYAETGWYRFRVQGDDGTRLYVDGVLVWDHWVRQSPVAFGVDVELSAGTHQLRYEYFDAEGTAIASIYWYLLEPGHEGGRGSNAMTSLVNRPALAAQPPALTPAMPSTPYSYPYTYTPSAGYTIPYAAPATYPPVSGVVSGYTAYPNYASYPAYPIYFTYPTMPVFYPFMPYYPAAPVVVPVAPADTAWRGEYYPNIALAGAPALVRQDASIAFDWGIGSPVPGLPADNFSVRWTRTLHFATAGPVTFTAATDDGVRVYVDGTLVINDWNHRQGQAITVQPYLTAGAHTVMMEYFENLGSARAFLDIAGTASAPVGGGLGAVNFWADRTVINAGENVTVCWQTQNIQAVYFMGGGVVGTGCHTEALIASKSYTLKAIHQNGFVDERVIMVVVN